MYLREEEFQKEVIDSKVTVLIDFFAEWCSPCKRLSPIIEDIAHEYKDKLKVFKINVEEAPQLCSRYGIISVPTLIIFKNGKVTEQINGLVSKEELKKKINPYL